MKVNLLKVIYSLNFQGRKSFFEGIFLWKNFDVGRGVGFWDLVVWYWINYSVVNVSIYFVWLGIERYCRGVVRIVLVEMYFRYS